MPFLCPGSCNSGRSTRVEGEPVWCATCGQIVRTALRGLPDAYSALGTLHLLSRAAPADAVRVAGTREPPSPAPGVDQQDAIFHLVRSWEEDLRLHLRHRGPRFGGGQAEMLDGTVRYLNRNFDAAISRSPGGREFGEEIYGAFAAAVRMVKNGPIRSRLIIPCPRCNRKALFQREGVSGKPWFTICEEAVGGCGVRYSEGEMTWVAEYHLAGAR